LQFADRIPRDNSKFLTKEIIRAQNVNFARKFIQKGG